MKAESIKDERGMALLMAMFLMSMALIILGTMTSRAINHARQVSRFEDHAQCGFGLQAAFAASEAELEAEQDGHIGITGWNPQSGLPNFSSPGLTPQTLPGTNVEYFAYVKSWDEDGADNLGNGLVDSGPETAFRSIHAFARRGNVVRTASTLYKEERGHTIWDYSIFAGPGKAGTPSIDNNFRSLGGIHILADNLTSATIVMKASVGFMQNNYSLIPPEYLGILSYIPSTIYENETVQTLNARLHVRKGMVGIWNPGYLGKPQTTGNAFKETLDGVYVKDGWVGHVNPDGTPQYVYTDILASGDQDDGMELEFPTMVNDSGTHYRNHYLQDFTANVSSPYTWKSGDLTLRLDRNYYFNASQGVEVSNKALGNSGMPTQAQMQTLLQNNEYFMWFNAATNQMVINGRIPIDGNFTVNPGGVLDNVLYYDGKGTIMAMDPVSTTTGTITLATHVLPRKLDGTTNAIFPEQCLLGLVAANDVVLNSLLGLTFMGAAYAGDSIDVNPLSCNIVGSAAANYYTLSNTPTFIHVAGLDDAFPTQARMIGLTGELGYVRVAYSES